MFLVYMKQCVAMARCMVSCWLICAVSVALKGGRPISVFNIVK